MVSWRKLVLLLLISSIQGCIFFEPKKENFYTDPLEESDVIRLPVIKPYDLVTIDSKSDWIVGKALVKDFGISGSIDSLNVQKGFITYCGFSNGIKWGVLDIDNLTKVDCSNYENFCLKTTSYNISPLLYNSKRVYEVWIETKQVPWADAIFIRDKSYENK